MKVDELVIKRFSELAQKAEEIDGTKYSGSDVVGVIVDSSLFQEWATSVLSLLKRTFGEDSIHFQHFDQRYREYVGRIEAFKVCYGILKSAIEDYEGGYLFNIKTLINAEVLDDVLEQAEEFYKAEYEDAACIIAGVALEQTLSKLSSNKNIETGKLDYMNSQLYKADVYNKLKMKQISAWADLRNKAAHGEWDEYSREDVEDMMKGVKRFIEEYAG